MADVKKIKEALEKIYQQGHQVKVTWDAGGDQTLCNVFIELPDGTQKMFPDTSEPKVSYLLVYEITDQLNLPNAGEFYHQGKGEIRINTTDDIELHFTSKAYDGDTHEVESSTQYLNLPTWASQVTPYLHRANFTVSGDMYEDGETSIYINLEFIEGDEIPLPALAKENYEKAVSQLFVPYKKMLMQGAGKQLGSVFIWGSMQADGQVKLAVEKYYNEVELYQNHIQKLFV